MSRITAVLFDKDGTLFDFNATWGAWAQGFLSELAEGEPARAASLGRAVGFDMQTGRYHPDSPVIAGTPEVAVELLLPHLPGMSPAGLAARMNSAAARAPLCEAVPLAPLLDALAGRGLALGVATNDAEAVARAHLAAAGVAGRFDFIAGCDSGHGAKPAPGPLLAFAAAVGRAPAEVVMVGDSRHDLAAGRAAGMATLGVLTGPAEAADLADLADAVVPDIGHLPAFLARRAA
ncbi:phosphoglycolate phosphatase [Rhodovulum iodosum]|uniref:phosphoglycolate phosphatase n=1 Tax=Rhodovulum iodosum TaxID=68291 RepID=A0ABV3XP99_9RHOB|nr:HAD family hydrolase [Rhodovulum robiginosum]RSK31554.1 HAD family hydrolase [Rhodovulum robiginosum]